MNIGDLLLLILAIALFLAGYSFVPQPTAYLLSVTVAVWLSLIAVRLERPRRARAVAAGTIAGVAVGALLSFLMGAAG